MKIRSCFVSNSSSSSFIIYKGFFKDLSKIKELESLYNQLVAEGEIYDERYSDGYFNERENYIELAAYGGWNKLEEFLMNTCGIADNQIYVTEG